MRGSRIEGGAEPGPFGVRTFKPDDRVAISEAWLPDAEAARRDFDHRLSEYAAQTVGEERLFRVDLVLDGVTSDSQHVLAGELTPERYALDSLSLTYLGVLASIALAVGFGLASLPTAARIATGVGVFAALLVLTRWRPARRLLLNTARYGIRDSNE